MPRTLVLLLNRISKAKGKRRIQGASNILKIGLCDIEATSFQRGSKLQTCVDPIRCSGKEPAPLPRTHASRGGLEKAAEIEPSGTIRYLDKDEFILSQLIKSV